MKQRKSNEAEIESLREEYHQRVATLERKVWAKNPSPPLLFTSFSINFLFIFMLEIFPLRIVRTFSQEVNCCRNFEVLIMYLVVPQLVDRMTLLPV